MVLEELGSKISSALRKLASSGGVDEAAFDAALREISNALAQSDVDIQLVMKLRSNVKKKVNFSELAAGVDKHAVIERAVRDELCSLLDGSGETPVVKPRRNKPFIVMFVGLQVRIHTLCNTLSFQCLECHLPEMYAPLGFPWSSPGYLHRCIWGCGCM